MRMQPGRPRPLRPDDEEIRKARQVLPAGRLHPAQLAVGYAVHHPNGGSYARAVAGETPVSDSHACAADFPPLKKGGRGDFPMRRYDPSLKEAARALRKEPTEAERKLWSKLRRRQILGGSSSTANGRSAGTSSTFWLRPLGSSSRSTVDS